MWICPKCSKQITDGSKICRQCGAILEEVEDSPPVEKVMPNPDRWADALAGEKEPVETSDDQDKREEEHGSTWTCGRCGVSVTETFDACWKCGTTRDGLEDADFVTESPEDVEEELPSIEASSEPPAVPRCEKCGSEKIIPDVMLVDQGQGSDGALKVVVFGNPEALLFKDRRYGKVQADICGECGHVELRVINPEELLRHYRESLNG